MMISVRYQKVLHHGYMHHGFMHRGFMHHGLMHYRYLHDTRFKDKDKAVLETVCYTKVLAINVLCKSFEASERSKDLLKSILKFLKCARVKDWTIIMSASQIKSSQDRMQ